MINKRKPGSRRRKLQLESLETRRCMDATMEMLGDTLFVRGSMEADAISILDHGNGRVSVSNSAVDAGRPVEFSGVANVLVRSKKGDDDVRYAMPDPSQGITDIVICMGPEGNNRFRFDAGPASLGDDAPHRLTINGGADSDDVALNFSQGVGNWTIHSDLRGGDDRLTADFAGNAGAVPKVAMNLRGGDGDDQYDLSFSRWFGETSLELDLGQGNDQVRASTGFIHPGSIFEFNPQPDPPGIDGVPGMRMSIQGDSGDDLVALALRGAPAEIDLHVDLGSGNDTLTTKLTAQRTADSEIIPCVKVAVAGGEGSDNVGLDLRGYAGISDIDVQLGAGADHLRVLADPTPEHFRARLSGDRGNDVIDVVFAELGEARGEIDCLILGGDGDDELSLIAGGVVEAKRLRARIDGGAGLDRARDSAHVAVVNCEG